MSHSVTLVVMPPFAAKDVEDTIAKVLAPFDENLEVAPHARYCWCVGRVAEAAGYQASKEAFGDLEVARAEFWKRHKDESHEATDAAWDAEVRNPRQAVEDKVVLAHPQRYQPDPACKDCHGTGWTESTYNPMSRWDWWVIGGRWSGAFVKDQDIFTVAQWRALFAANPKQATAFAILTTDGKWHERGEMGWWGMVSNEQDIQLWQQQMVTILRDVPDEYLLVSVDVHI